MRRDLYISFPTLSSLGSLGTTRYNRFAAVNRTKPLSRQTMYFTHLFLQFVGKASIFTLPLADNQVKIQLKKTSVSVPSLHFRHAPSLPELEDQINSVRAAETDRCILKAIPLSFCHIPAETIYPAILFHVFKLYIYPTVWV